MPHERDLLRVIEGDVVTVAVLRELELAAVDGGDVVDGRPLAESALHLGRRTAGTAVGDLVQMALDREVLDIRGHHLHPHERHEEEDTASEDQADETQAVLTTLQVHAVPAYSMGVPMRPN